MVGVAPDRAVGDDLGFGYAPSVPVHLPPVVIQVHLLVVL